jgi:hypothetical protein
MPENICGICFFAPNEDILRRKVQNYRSKYRLIIPENL